MEKKYNISICICYVGIDGKFFLRDLIVHIGCTINEAIVYSKFNHDFIDVNYNQNNVGIFGKIKSIDTILVDGDRIEIYRPLINDPKKSRRIKSIMQRKKILTIYR
ncbi:hypothetical protein BCUE_0576 [Candidatus Kinetoplastibacterium blastocrithidii TCC012E]|uniref:UPF0125 protein BCUE_0576 n=1 Tax=Candidatus Kinetoplastidibacterium blastocrithidiae TCC012E TaxID=1208922 RepID=M1LBG3_9PROT|nr:RnfH family protein [Candidatus Kinetoplastibacterium blastocrithidii]AFZ83647.1 protein RnfH [Candidatus Kinetoplastibacterium blastocrithidii (ex Strigomonas culicis)]AGF49768.1 hypothetical protein BCUE_0576 [Candidatus Kinetoplastibacterium blastocrithidii TCC012E]